MKSTSKLWTATALLLGTGFGLGYCPLAPGTVGSLLGPVLVWSWQQARFPFESGVVAALVLIAAGIPICSQAAKSFGRNDPGQVVFDEIAAFPLVFAAVPVDLLSGVLGFVWFRLFDILKPWPVCRLEKFPRGLGIMADDVAAGAYAAAALWLTVRVFQ